MEGTSMTLSHFLPRARRFLRAVRAEPGLLRRWLAVRFLFAPVERLFGYHLTADHFYDPVPNTRTVARRYRDDPWRFPLAALALEESEARGLALVAQWGEEFLAALGTCGYDPGNSLFPPVDALFLYALLREHAPRVVLEVGQGQSTRVALAALARNARERGISPRFVSVDLVDRSNGRVPQEVHFEPVVGDVTVTVGEDLIREAELLFFDTSHVLKWGSDVDWVFRFALPRTAPGTLVHFHDIFTPFDYPRAWIVEEKRFWNEQYVLEALLHGGDRFEVYLPLHALGRLSPRFHAALAALGGSTLSARPGQSFWLRRRADS